MKGHSERVPRKNLRAIAGRPLFYWVTEALRGAELVDEVMVDTDSDEIVEAVSDLFPEVTLHRRPEHLHGDFVPMHDIVAYVAADFDHETILQTHSTNPLLTSPTIDSAIGAFFSDGPHDSLMAVTPRYARFYTSGGDPVNHTPGELLRTQDLPPLLEENSNLYISSRSLIQETGLRVGSNPLLFEMTAAESIDIDDQFDFKIAESMLREIHG